MKKLTSAGWVGVGWGGCCRPGALQSLCPEQVLLWQLLVAQPASRVAVLGGWSPGCAYGAGSFVSQTQGGSSGTTGL